MPRPGLYLSPLRVFMLKIKIIFVLAAVCFCRICVFAELYLTGVENEKNYYAVTFNNAIRIYGVSLSNGKVLLPEYAKGGKIYRNFSVLDRNFAKNLHEDLKLGKTYAGPSQNFSKTAYKINKFKIIQSHKTVRAFASVIFEDKLEVECRVMDGKYGLWIAWPSKEDGGIWKKDFIIINKYLKNSIETELIKRYTS
jgi:DNA-binding cell septation regulator SpoVG